MYTAVVLDEKSHLKLVNWANDNIKKDGVRLPMLVRDKGWKMYCHHMTVTMGPCPDFLQNQMGETHKLDVTHYGVSDDAIAVRVVGFYSKNQIPHVTVAVNVKGGAKPVDSNKITKWVQVESPIKLSGELKEVQ